VSWHKENLNAEVILGKVVLWNVSHVNLRAMCANSINFYTLFEVICDSNNLGVIALDVYLFDLTIAEPSNVSAQKVFKQNSVFLEVASGHKSCVHDNVICFFMITQHRHQMLGYKLMIVLFVTLI